MDKFKERAIALRDECERLAVAAEKRAGSFELTAEERFDAVEQAKVYWQMSRVHADAVQAASEVRPDRFTGKNKGPQPKTVRRIAFLRSVATKIGSTKRASVIAAAHQQEGFADLFDSYEAAYRLAEPSIFDGIRNRSK